MRKDSNSANEHQITQFSKPSRADGYVDPRGKERAYCWKMDIKHEKCLMGRTGMPARVEHRIQPDVRVQGRLH